MRHITLLHNPTCSKSRQALELLGGRDIRLTRWRVLDDPLTVLERDALISRPSPDATGWVQTRDVESLGVVIPGLPNRAALMRQVVEQPRLLGRPIAVSSGKAVVTGPATRVLERL